MIASVSPDKRPAVKVMVEVGDGVPVAAIIHSRYCSNETKRIAILGIIPAQTAVNPCVKIETIVEIGV
jgi:hypothetical protein